MGHRNLETDLAYHRLQQRLDRMVTGAPDAPALRAILRLLFTPEEAELAARMPTLCSVRSLAERVGRDEAELEVLVTSMARRGLVVDLEHRGERWVALAPVVIGFFEYTFMRVGAMRVGEDASVGKSSVIPWRARPSARSVMAGRVRGGIFGWVQPDGLIVGGSWSRLLVGPGSQGRNRSRASPSRGLPPALAQAVR